MAHKPTIHNPTNFEPKDYEVLDYLDNKRPVFFGDSSIGAMQEYQNEVKAWEAEMRFALGDDWRTKANHCVHCGNGRVRWITVCLHLPTQTRVVFGADCTERLGFANKMEFKLAMLQQRDAARKVRFKLWNQRQAFLATHPDFAAAIVSIGDPVHAKNSFAHDVVDKLNRWGSLSEKQMSAVIDSLKRDVTRAAEYTAQAVESKGDAPNGRVEVTGTVLSVQIRETDFGPTKKMLVKLANNSKVWLTVPSGSGIERNDQITVRASFQVSKDDKSFAFGSRPTLVHHVSAQGV